MRRPGRPIALVLAGVSAALVIVGLGRWFTTLDPLRCDPGLEGLGCALASVGVAILVLAVLAAAVDYAVLRLLQVEHALPIAGLALLTTGAWWMLIQSLAGVRGLRITLLVVAIPIANVAFEAVVRRAVFGRATVPLVAAAVIVAAVPFSALASGVDSARSSRSQERAMEEAGFTTYVSGYVPSGYRRSTVRFVREFGPSTPAHAEVDYIYGNNDPGDPGVFTVTSFRAPSTFDPPRNCGTAQPGPDSPSVSCVDAGRTTSGQPVYWDEGRSSNIGVYFIKLADTVVTIETDTRRGLRPRDAVRVANSLRPY